MLAWIGSGTIDFAALARLSTAVRSGEIDPATLPSVGPGPEIAAVLTFAAGAAIGGFFAGRASPHKSYAEPAIAAALVVGSLVLLIYSTPMGEIAVGFTRGHVERIASTLGAVGLIAGLGGAVLGELATFGTGRAGPIRWTGIAILITAGALFAATLFAAIVLLNETAEAALRNYFAWEAEGRRGPLVEVPIGRIVGLGVSAVAVAAVLGGAVSQLAAPKRMVGPAAIAALIVLGGAGAGVIAALPDNQSLPPPIVGGAFAGAAVAAASAFITLAVRRAFGQQPVGSR